MNSSIAERKHDHLEICLRQGVGSDCSSGLEDFRLEYDALPELDLESVDLSVTVLGRRLAAPLLIGAMTGGSEHCLDINMRLARVAARLQLGMFLGSQRAMLDQPSLAASFMVREAAPDLPLLVGNIGASQLADGLDAARINQALDKVRADALAIHLNPLQEAIQPEGRPCFSGLYQRLAEVLPLVERPVLIKEVGHGLSALTAAKLATLPIAGVDVAGVGGTSWLRVEAYRAPEGSIAARLGQRLAGFGVPTAQSIVACRRVLGERLVLASGGIRKGHDVAVALALGAHAAALAQPLLGAVAHSEQALEDELRLIIEELRLLCFASGAADIAALRRVRLLDRAGDFVEDW